MFIGHLLAGYLINCTLAKCLLLMVSHVRWAMIIGLVGAVASDFDLFLFPGRGVIKCHKQIILWFKVFLSEFIGC